MSVLFVSQLYINSTVIKINNVTIFIVKTYIILQKHTDRKY